MSSVSAAPWTVTYAPGSWLALAGPATLVVVPPMFASQAAELWPCVASARDVDELAAALARHGIDELDRFAAFFVAGGRLRSLVRGDLTLTLADETLTPGHDLRTWAETELGEGARVALTLDEHPGSTRLPLLAGVVLVSALVLDQSAALDLDEVAQAVSARPTADGALADDRESARPADAADEAAATEADESAPSSDDTAGDDSGTVLARPAWAQEPEADAAAGTVVEEPAWHTPDGTPGTIFDAPHWAHTDERHAFEGEYNSGLFWPPKALLPTQQVAVATPDEPALLDSVPSWVTHGSRALESPPEESTVYSTGIASTHKPRRQADDDRILAALCAGGHANPPHSHRCRRCGAPVNQGTPTLVPRPVLAQVVASTGQYADVRDLVLVGRAPTAPVGEFHASLMPVPSVNKDISRTHLRIEVRDWAVEATDLHSTNGTLLIAGTGAQPQPLVPGVPTPVQIGDALDLGDGVVLHLGTPR